MRAVVPHVPESWLKDRARSGVDRYDELWEGVLHMPPAPGFGHQQVGNRLFLFLAPRLGERGIELFYETAVHRPGSGGQDYRVPDLVFFRPDTPGLVVPRGLEGAPLAVLEIRSPDDETYDKLEFYARLGVGEVIVMELESRQVEVFRLAGERYVAVSADNQRRVHAATIDVRFATTADAPPRLHVECGGVATRI
jgi:Uma2 family endonuclease